MNDYRLLIFKSLAISSVFVMLQIAIIDAGSAEMLWLGVAAYILVSLAAIRLVNKPDVATI